MTVVLVFYVLSAAQLRSEPSVVVHIILKFVFQSLAHNGWISICKVLNGLRQTSIQRTRVPTPAISKQQYFILFFRCENKNCNGFHNPSWGDNFQYHGGSAPQGKVHHHAPLGGRVEFVHSVDPSTIRAKGTTSASAAIVQEVTQQLTIERRKLESFV